MRGASLTVTLEAVTPLFLTGADPRGAPELRPPALRGALRYWLRAALGGTLGDDVGAVREAEAAVFGSTDERLGGAGAVSVRLRPGQSAPVSAYRREPAQRVVRDGRELLQPTGRDYLYWSMAGSGNQGAKQYLEPGAQFHLQLAARPGAPDPERCLQQAEAALWLLLQLGGVGSRSRRTAGSLSAVHVDEGDDAYGFVLRGQTVLEIARDLAQGLFSLRASFSSLGAGQVSVRPRFDVLRPEACRVWVLGTWPGWAAAVEAVGAAIRGFRNRREPDHQRIARWLSGNPIPEVERAVFGLPLPVRYTRGPRDTIQSRLGNADINRRASPLWLKISRLADGRRVAGVATLFTSQFLPAGARLYARHGGPPVPQPQDYRLIERFIAECFPGAAEVSYG